MSMILAVPPAAEPITLAEAKAYLKIDAQDEDLLVQSLVTAARVHLEALTGRAFVTQTWRIIRDIWPANGILALPIAPIASISAVRVTTASGVVSVPLTGLRLDGRGAPARLSWAAAPPSPTVGMAGIEIECVAGYGAPADVPAPLAQAIRLLAAHWFENRGVISVGHEVAVMPRSVEALVAPYIVRRIA